MARFWGRRSNSAETNETAASPKEAPGTKTVRTFLGDMQLEVDSVKKAALQELSAETRARAIAIGRTGDYVESDRLHGLATGLSHKAAAISETFDDDVDGL